MNKIDIKGANRDTHRLSPRLVETVGYTGKYPNMIEFKKPWESAIQVGPGSGQVSFSGTPLESDGFTWCAGLLLLDANFALFHFDELDLRPEYVKPLEQLKGGGQYLGLFIRGSLSRNFRGELESTQYFYRRGVNVKLLSDEIMFNSGKAPWNMLFRPLERRVYIDLRAERKMLTYQI